MESLRIRIPQRYEAGIVKLIALPDESVNELISALDEMPSTFNTDRLRSQISSKIGLISMDDLEDIINTLESLYILRFDRELSLDEFIEQITQAMNASTNQNLRIRESSYSRFKENLRNLLSGKLLSVSTRAKNLIFEHDHVLGRMRVMTDIRSIFGEGAVESPIGAVIVHMLKLHYIQDLQHKDFFVALDTADLSALIDVLKQAQEKAHALKSALASANIPYIDSE